jgi:hypothetical protein
MDERDDTMAALDAVVDFVLRRGCPCAFPRVRFLLTFDPAARGLGPHAIEFTQCLIFKFTSRGAAQDAVLIDEKDQDSCRCKICGSGYRHRFVDYSINMSYACLDLVDDRSRQIGANVEFPVPLAGAVLSFEGSPAAEDANFLALFENANGNPQSLVDYMTLPLEPLRT